MLQKTAAQQAATPVWPLEPDDAPELEDIIAKQAKTISAQFVLLAEYQAVLDAAQHPPSGTAATGTGTANNSTSLTVTAVTGPIVTGAVVAGNSVPADTTVLGQISGTTGGNGVYLISSTINISSTPLTFTPPPPASTWPVPGDALTLNLISQQQTTILRQQNALLQAYQDLLNSSETPKPM